MTIRNFNYPNPVQGKKVNFTAYKDLIKKDITFQSAPQHRAERKQERLIPTIPFTGMPVIQPISLQDYSNISYYLDKMINTREHIREPVAVVIVNMFLNLPNKVCAPGKDYSVTERQYNKDQLVVFQDSLKVAGLLFDHEYISKWDIGNFRHKEMLQTRSLSGLMGTMFWDGKGDFHLLHIRNPSAIIPDDSDAESIAYDMVTKRHKDRIKEIESYASQLSNNTELADIEKIMLVKEKPDFDIMIRACEKYAAEHPDMTAIQRDFLAKIPDILRFMEKFEQEIRDEAAKLRGTGSGCADELGLVKQLASNLASNGVLILESSGLKEIPGLRPVAHYEHASLYQKSA